MNRPKTINQSNEKEVLGLECLKIEGLQKQLDSLMCKFDNSTYRLKLVLEEGGKLKKEEIDYYNYIHSCIMEVIEKIRIEKSR